MTQARIELTAKDDTGAAFGSVRGKLDGLKNQAVGVSSAFSGIAGQLGALAATSLIGIKLKGAIDAADQLDDLSEKSGIAVEALSGLRFAGEVVGTSTEAIATGVRKLAVAMAAASGGAKEQTAIFDALQVNYKNLDGTLRNTDDVLGDVATKFQSFKDGPEKAALAIQLFGKSGEAMIPLLNKGGDGIASLREEAVRLGATFGGELASSAAEFNDNLKRLELASEGTAAAIAGEFLPSLNLIIKEFLSAENGGRTLAEFFGGTLNTVFTTLAVVVAEFGFVLKAIGREIGAVAAQIGILPSALASLDFSGFTAISDAVKEDGARARKELDKFTSSLLSAGLKSTAGAGGGRGSIVDDRFALKQGAAPIVPGGGGGGGGSAKEAKSAYDALNKSVAERLRTMQEELTLGRALTEQEKFSAKLKADIALATNKLSAAEKKSLETSLKQVEAEGQRLDLQRADLKQAVDTAATRSDLRKKESDDIAKFLADEKAARIETVKAANEAVANAQLEFDSYELTRSQVEQLTLARLADKLAAVDSGSEIAKSIQAEIEAQQKLIDIYQKGEARDVAAKTAKDAAEEWKKTADSIESDLTNALLRGFESGKGFGKNLRDTLKNMFKTLVLQPTISAILKPVAGGLSGLLGGGQALAGGGGAGGGSNLLSGISNFASSISSFGTVVSQFASGTMSFANAAGTLFANGTGTSLSGFLATSGAFGTSASSAIAANLALPAGTAAALPAGTLAAGSAAGAGGFAAAAGSVVAIAAPLLIAALAVNEFRKGPVLTMYEGFRGTYSTEGGLNAQNERNTQQNNGAFVGNKRETTYSPLEEATRIRVTSAFEAITKGTKDFAKMLGLSTSVLDKFSTAVGVQDASGLIASMGIKGVTQLSTEEQMQRLFSGAADDMARSILTGRTSNTANFDAEFYRSQLTDGLTPAEIAAKSGNAAQFSLDQQQLQREQDPGLAPALLASVVEGQQLFLANLNAANDFRDRGKAAGLRANVEDGVQVGEDNSRFIREGETASKALERLAVSLGGVNSIFGELNFKLLDVSISSADAASQLLDLFGGVEKFTAANQAYYQNFFTEEEKKARLQQQLADAFKAANIAQPVTRADFRTQVETAATKVDTAEGRATYAALLQLAPLFASLTPVIESAAAAVDVITDRLQGLLDIRKNLEADLLEAQGDTTGAAAARRALAIIDFTAAEVAAFDYNESLRAQIATQQQITQAARDAADAVSQLAGQLSGALAGLADTRFNLENDLLSGSGQNAEVRKRIRDRDIAALGEGQSAADIAKIAADYDYNESLRDQIAAQQAAAAAAQQAAQAASDAASKATSAAEAVRDAWASIVSSILQEVDRIRGTDQASTPESRAKAQSAFAIATAQAESGSQEAAKLLPKLSQDLLRLIEEGATSSLEIARARAQISGRLEQTAALLGGQPVQSQILAPTPAANVPQVFVPVSPQVFNSESSIIAELQRLNTEVARLSALQAEGNSNTLKSSDTLTRVSRGGVSVFTTPA